MVTQPHKLVLRCYACGGGQERWYAVCLELNLAVEADTLHEIKVKMKDAIFTYLDTVLDTDDIDSIPYLLYRPAPIRDWAVYYFIKALNFITNPPRKLIFKEAIPVHLACGC